MTKYHVYSNGGSGPIDYGAPAATVAGLSWVSDALAVPGPWKFGVRAFDPDTGLEEQNIDCAVRIELSAGGRDITNLPAAPLSLRALPLPGGSARVEWHYPLVRGSKSPTGFRVYLGTGGTPDYSALVAIVAASAGFMNTFRATLAGLAGGTTYTVGVRAENASGEEANAITAGLTAADGGPDPVDSLSGSAI